MPALRLAVSQRPRFTSFFSVPGIFLSLHNNQFSQIRTQPRFEVCWYLHEALQQFRLAGHATLIDAARQEADLSQLRTKAWQRLSGSTKQQYFMPQPGAPRDDAVLSASMEQSPPDSPPPSTFALVLCRPSEVDHITLGDPMKRVLHRQDPATGEWESPQDLNP